MRISLLYKLLLENAISNLEKYVYDAGARFLSSKDIEDLLKDYPLEKNILVYRGLFFHTREEFEDFLSKIKNNKIEIESYSSWSPSMSTGKQFALTKPTNNIMLLGREFFKKEDERHKKRDYTQGYGVVLSTVAHKGQAIDVNRTSVGQESEVILPKGKYTVKVVKTFLPHEEASKSIDINSYIQSQRGLSNKDDKDLQYSLMQHILQNYNEKLTDKSRKYLFYMFSSNLNNLEVVFKEPEGPSFRDDITNPGHYPTLYSTREKKLNAQHNKERYVTGKPSITIPFSIKNLNNNLIYYMPLFLEEDRERVKEKITDVMFDLAEKTIEYRNKYEKKYDIFFEGEVRHLQPYLDKNIIEMVAKGLNSTIGSIYSYMNSKTYLDRINSIKDPEKKRDAMYHYTDTLKRLLQKIS